MLICNHCDEEAKNSELYGGRCVDCAKTVTVNLKDIESLVSYSHMCAQYLFDAGYGGKSQSLTAKANAIAAQIY